VTRHGAQALAEHPGVMNLDRGKGGLRCEADARENARAHRGSEEIWIRRWQGGLVALEGSGFVCPSG
jgi:hypothetical protein